MVLLGSWLWIAGCASGGLEDELDADEGAHASVALKAACESGTAHACAELAGFHLAGNGVELNLERAAELYSQACGGGDGDGCAALGAMHQSGDGMPRDLTRSAELFDKACEQDVVDACGRLAAMHLEAAGVPEDVKKAVKLFEKACQGGQGESCSTLAGLYALGAKVPRNPAKALRFAKRGCNADHVRSCCQKAEQQILAGDDRDARTLLEGLLVPEPREGIDPVVIYGLLVASGEKLDRIAPNLIGAWIDAPDHVNWSWDPLAEHLRDEKKRKSRESLIVIELLGAPKSEGSEAALRAALDIPE